MVLTNDEEEDDDGGVGECRPKLFMKITERSE
jgi:hypothetical protein